MDTRVVVSRRHCIALGIALCANRTWAAPAPTRTPPQKARTADNARANAAAQAAARPVKLLVVGDSLSAEYGLRRGTGWVALLDQEFQRNQRPAQVTNASISGDTTAGGRSRLPRLLEEDRPTHLIVELGGNDALRGLPLPVTEANLRAMAQAGHAAGAKVMIVGVDVPPNYGSQYVNDFHAVFERVARSENAALVPSLLSGIADDPDPLRWFQADRIHPVEDAQPRMLENVWSVLRGWL